MTLSKMLCEHGELSGCFDCMVGGKNPTYVAKPIVRRGNFADQFRKNDASTAVGGYIEIMQSAKTPAPIQRDPMSDAQRSYLASLIRTNGTDAHRALDLDDLGKWDASKMIDELRNAQRTSPKYDDGFRDCLNYKSCGHLTRNASRFCASCESAMIADGRSVPAPSPLPVVEDGRYAIDIDDTTKFYRVNTGRDGRKWLDVQASDDFHPIHNYATKHAILTAIAADPRAALVRYGQLLGKCGICGRTLTDEQSRSDGIGPICNGRTA